MPYILLTLEDTEFIGLYHLAIEQLYTILQTHLEPWGVTQCSIPLLHQVLLALSFLAI